MFCVNIRSDELSHGVKASAPELGIQAEHILMKRLKSCKSGYVLVLISGTSSPLQVLPGLGIRNECWLLLLLLLLLFVRSDRGKIRMSHSFFSG